MNYTEKQLDRFANTPRQMRGQVLPVLRAGKIVSAGSRADTDDASFWNVEILGSEFQPVDMNINDRYGTGNSVVTVLMNVAAPVGSGYSQGDIVSVFVAGSLVNSLFEANATDGRLYVAGDGCFIVSGGGGSGTCFYNINTFGVLTG